MRSKRKRGILGAYQDLQCALHVAHVKDVSVVVFGSNSKVVGFHRVPGQAVGREVENGSMKRGVCARVVQNDSSVGRA